MLFHVHRLPGGFIGVERFRFVQHGAPVGELVAQFHAKSAQFAGENVARVEENEIRFRRKRQEASPQIFPFASVRGQIRDVEATMRTFVSISVASMMMMVGSLAFAQGEPAGTGGTAGGTAGAGGTATVTTPTPPVGSRRLTPTGPPLNPDQPTRHQETGRG